MAIVWVLAIATSLAGVACGVGSLLNRYTGNALSVAERCATSWALTWAVLGGLSFVAARNGALTALGGGSCVTGFALLAWQRCGPNRRVAELHTWMHDALTRRIISVQALATTLLLALVCVTRTFTVIGWRGDWEEHWERTAWMANRGPLTTVFSGGYVVPARPPLTNALVATLTAVGGLTWPSYLLALALVSSMVMLPMLTLVGPGLLRVGFGATTLIVVSAPALVAQMLFPWTKLASASLVLSAVIVHRRLSRRLTNNLAFVEGVLLGAAVLAHYSAAAFALTAGLDLFVRFVLRRRQRSVALVFCAGFGLIAVLLPWLAWSYWRYGAGTWNQTSTVSTASGSLVGRTVANLIGHVLLFPAVASSSRLVLLRDVGFAALVTNGVGAVGLPVLASVKSISRGFSKRIVALLGIAIVVGTTTLPEAIMGGAHVVLVPVSLMACAALLFAFPSLSRLGRRAVLALAALQWAFFAGLHGYLLMTPVSTAARYLSFDARRRESLGVQTIGDLLGRPLSVVVWAIAVVVPLMALSRDRSFVGQRSDQSRTAASTTACPGPSEVVDSVGSEATPVSALNTADVESVRA